MRLAKSRPDVAGGGFPCLSRRVRWSLLRFGRALRTTLCSSYPWQPPDERDFHVARHVATVFVRPLQKPTISRSASRPGLQCHASLPQVTFRAESMRLRVRRRTCAAMSPTVIRLLMLRGSSAQFGRLKRTLVPRAIRAESPPIAAQYDVDQPSRESCRVGVRAHREPGLRAPNRDAWQRQPSTLK